MSYSSNTYGDLFQDEDGDGSVDEDTCMYANAQIQHIRNSEVLSLSPFIWGSLFRTHYYGLIYDGGAPDHLNFIEGCSSHPDPTRGGIPSDGPYPDTTAVGPVGPAGNVGPPQYSWDTDRSYGDWYAAHELAHTFGRLHLRVATGCTSNATADLDDNDVDGRVSPNPPIEPYYVGLDSGDNLTSGPLPIAAVPGSKYDIMTYCNPVKWIGPYTYEGIRKRLAEENAPIELLEEVSLERHKYIIDPAGPVVGMRILQGDFLNVLAIVNFKRGTGSIHQVDRIKHIVAKPQTHDKRIQIRVTHLDGKVITYPIEVRQNIDTSPDKRTLGIINTPIPFTDNIATIELVMAGARIGELGVRESKTLDTIKVIENHLSVEGISLPKFRSNSEFFMAPILLTWKPSDTDSTPLRYTVQFSSDNGSTWQTLGIGLTKSELEIDPKLFKALTDVKIKVIVSDRFNKGEQIVSLTIPEK